MRAVTRAAREYRTGYKKRETTSDPYTSRGAKGKIEICGSCRAVHRNKRWYADDAMFRAAQNDPSAMRTACPACLKIRDHFPGGIVTLKGDFVLPHKDELMNLIRNEEERARGFNPLERVMSIKENGFGGMIISTTNEKLAQRLGRAIKKAFHGAVTYRWSHDNKLVRVEWLREG